MEVIVGIAATATGLVAGAAVDTVFNICKANEKFNIISEPQPILRHAQIPKILKHAAGWKDEKVVGFTVGKEDEQFATAQSLVFIQDWITKRNGNNKFIVPKNALSVSFVTENFKVGKSAQEFIPVNHTMPSDAFFSYQMLSTQSQATFYNEDGIAYLAGICYYLTPKGQKMEYCMSADLVKIKMTLSLAEPFPQQDRLKRLARLSTKIYSRVCKTAGKRVSLLIDDDGELKHQEYDYSSRKLTLEFCEECDKELKEYKFVPKVAPEVVVVEQKPKEKLEEPKKAQEPEESESEEPKEIKEDEPLIVEETDETDSEDSKDFDFCDEMDVMSIN